MGTTYMINHILDNKNGDQERFLKVNFGLAEVTLYIRCAAKKYREIDTQIASIPLFIRVRPNVMMLVYF